MTDPSGPAPQGAPPTPPPAVPQAPPPAVPQAPPPTWLAPASAAPAGPGSGKSRAVAAAFALLVGGLGIHKFYLGKTALGVLYLLLSWTGIPSLVAWIEGITYLAKSDWAWAAEYGGPVEPANGAAIGCLWLVALLPLVGILGFVALVLGGWGSQI